MTRAEVLESYNVDANGIIRNPGKFEGEMLYAPYFYDAVMNGDGEHIGEADFFEITEDDRKEFPELAPDDYGATLCESETGFVYVRIYGKDGYELLKSECEEYDAAQAEE